MFGVQSDSFVLIVGCKDAPLGSIGSISSILISAVVVLMVVLVLVVRRGGR